MTEFHSPPRVFHLEEAVEILSNTPEVLQQLLGDLSVTWTSFCETSDQWSSFDIVGHLAYGEQTDWIVRAEIILEEGDQREFEPFDRFAQFERFEGWSLGELLDLFSDLRRSNLATLEEWSLKPSQLRKTGRHPDFGRVTLEQLLAAWVVHDLGHISQITRTMARRLTREVGPWRQYLPVLPPSASS